MPSNKHYEIDLTRLKVAETEAPTFEELLRLADLPNTPNPFGNRLKRGKFVNDDGRKWLLDKQLSKFSYQASGDNHKIAQFKLTFWFDAPLELSDIDAERFLYSVSRRIAESSWRGGRRGASAYFQLGHLEEGSIRGDIYAGLVAVGAFVVAYPDLKVGFQEILTDASFVTEHISTAVRAAKLPTPNNGGRDHEIPSLYAEGRTRRRVRPERQRLTRED